MIENYIYLYHISKCIILPTWPESIQDSQSVTFTPTTPLGRTAPIYSYSYSGPRTVQVNLKLHRDMMYDINYVESDLLIDTSDDYIDAIVSQIQSIALPQYDSAAKMINPPLVAVRFGDEFFIKGVVTGSVGVTSELPIIQRRDGKSKYAQVNLSFSVSEVTPFDASTVWQIGSFRNVDTNLERNIWRYSSNPVSGISSARQQF